MTQEEQNKLWTELSEESKERIKIEYKESMDGSDLKRSINYLFGEHNLKPSLTYEDICKKLAKDFTTVSVSYSSGKLMADKISAIHKLLMVAKFLNKNEDGTPWKPDWKDWGYKPSESKWYFLICDREILIKRDDVSCSAPVYFRTKEIAQQAIEILGEDIIITALTTEY